MPQLLLKFILVTFYILPFINQAQFEKTDFSKGLKGEYNRKDIINRALFLLNNNKIEEAYIMLHRILKRKKIGSILKVNSYLLLGTYFNKKQLIDSSSYYAQKAIFHSKNIKNDSIKNRALSFAYNSMAICNTTKGLFNESLKWHIKGVKVSEKYNEEKKYYTHIHGLARVYMEKKDYKKALKFFKECLTYKGDNEIRYASYINLGAIYSLLNDYKSSNKFYEEALKIIKNNDYAIAVIKLDLAVSYQEQNNIEKAILLYKEAIQLSKQKGYKKLIVLGNFNIGSVYSELKKYKEAELMFSLSLVDAVNFGYLDQQKLIYDELKKIYMEKNDYRKVFQFANKSFTIQDSINKLQKDKEINELEVKYKTLQKEKEIKLLQKENYSKLLELKNQKEVLENLKLKQKIEEKENENKILAFENTAEKKRNEIIVLKKDKDFQNIELEKEKSIRNIILYSFLIFLIPIVGLLVIYYQKLQTQSELTKKEREVSNQKISNLIKEQELKVIKASVSAQDKERKRIAQELHDSIGGNLAAIKIKVNNFRSDEKVELTSINAQIDNTYEQVRDFSHNLTGKSFNENNFCDVLEEYINSIWGANCSFVVFPRKEVNLLNQNLQIEIFKIIQELTTNTLKYAKATFIELQMNLVEGELNILFEDNGVGFDSIINKDGIGFQNIKNRLKEFKGIFEIDSVIDRGTIVNIGIPILININNEV